MDAGGTGTTQTALLTDKSVLPEMKSHNTIEYPRFSSKTEPAGDRDPDEVVPIETPDNGESSEEIDKKPGKLKAGAIAAIAGTAALLIAGAAGAAVLIRRKKK